jgi:hypothetical protein
VRLLWQKRTLICLVLKTCLKFNLYYVLHENSNMIILKLWGVCRTQSCDHPRGLEIIWGISNMVISKLRGLCLDIQSCDPPHGLEITWGLKMSKLLNLITFSLACLLTCTNWVLSYICECLVKHTSWIFVALTEMMLVSLYMLVLVEIGVFMLLWWTCLTYLFTSFHILAHGYLLVISLW